MKLKLNRLYKKDKLIAIKKEKYQIINLDKLPLNKKAIVKEIKCKKNVERRLLDLGLIQGTNITPILISPSKDPRAFWFRGSIIAIRKEDAEKIRVVKSGE